MKVPTDLEILDAIYQEYYNEFVSFDEGKKNGRISKIYVPIDSDRISKRLGVDTDIIWGRLYYHLNQKFSYTQPEGPKVPFFQLSLRADGREDKNSIQFPLMASILADLQKENRKHKAELFISLGALLISIVSIIIAVFVK